MTAVSAILLFLTLNTASVAEDGSVSASELPPAEPPHLADWSISDAETIGACTLAGAVITGTAYFAVGALAHSMLIGSIAYTQTQAWLLAGLAVSLPIATSTAVAILFAAGGGLRGTATHAAVVLGAGLLAGISFGTLAASIGAAGLSQRILAQPGGLTRSKLGELDLLGTVGVLAAVAVYAGLPLAVAMGSGVALLAARLGFVDALEGPQWRSSNRE